VNTVSPVKPTAPSDDVEPKSKRRKQTMPFERLRKPKKPEWIELSYEQTLSAIEQYLWSMRLVKDTDKVTSMMSHMDHPVRFELRKEVSGK
jgi:hypothetical protein